MKKSNDQEGETLQRERSAPSDTSIWKRFWEWLTDRPLGVLAIAGTVALFATTPIAKRGGKGIIIATVIIIISVVVIGAKAFFEGPSGILPYIGFLIIAAIFMTMLLRFISGERADANDTSATPLFKALIATAMMVIIIVCAVCIVQGFLSRSQRFVRWWAWIGWQKNLQNHRTPLRRNELFNKKQGWMSKDQQKENEDVSKWSEEAQDLLLSIHEHQKNPSIIGLNWIIILATALFTIASRFSWANIQTFVETDDDLTGALTILFLIGLISGFINGAHNSYLIWIRNKSLEITRLRKKTGINKPRKTRIRKYANKWMNG